MTTRSHGLASPANRLSSLLDAEAPPSESANLLDRPPLNLHAACLENGSASRDGFRCRFLMQALEHVFGVGKRADPICRILGFFPRLNEVRFCSW